MGIYYRTGFKYQLSRPYTHQLSFRPAEKVTSGFFTISVKGLLAIKAGYAWDGASGPTKDTKNSMRGSLVHDALYQAIREGGLPTSARSLADAEFWKVIKEDKMRWWRAFAWWRAVSRFGAEAASKVREELTAP